MKNKFQIILLILIFSSLLEARSGKITANLKFGSGYLESLKESHIDTDTNQTVSLSTFVIGYGVDIFDRSGLYGGAEVEYEMVNEIGSNWGSLATVYGKLGLYGNNMSALYLLGGYSYQDLENYEYGDGFVYGAGIKANVKRHVGVEFNIKRHRLVSNQNEDYTVNSATVNYVMYW